MRISAKILKVNILFLNLATATEIHLCTVTWEMASWEKLVCYLPCYSSRARHMLTKQVRLLNTFKFYFIDKAFYYLMCYCTVFGLISVFCCILFWSWHFQSIMFVKKKGRSEGIAVYESPNRSVFAWNWVFCENLMLHWTLFFSKCRHLLHLNECFGCQIPIYEVYLSCGFTLIIFQEP